LITQIVSSKKAVINQCNETIVALTAEEILAVAGYVVTESSNIDVIIVEENISKEYATAFQAHDIRIYTGHYVSLVMAR